MDTTGSVIDFATIVPKIDKILARGLSVGMGEAGGQICVEAAICEALGLPHGDDPKCVALTVRSYKIRLNDSNWSSPAARAAGMRNLAIAQLGSLGVVDNSEFAKRLVEKSIRVLIPALFEQVFTSESEAHQKCRDAAEECRKNGNYKSAKLAQKNAAAAAAAAYAAAYAAAAAAAYAAAYAAAAAAYAATYAAAAAAAYAAAAANRVKSKTDPDRYLKLSASLALEVLQELRSPGCAYI